jgi:hypothetical protein
VIYWLPLFRYHQVCCRRGDLFKYFDALLDVLVLLLYPHHPHLPLDHCSLLGLDHLVQHLLHDYLDQGLVRVE